jgi:hypothetical protein
MRWIMRSIKRSERGRGHESVRKYKEKREEEGARKREKAQCAKEAYERGGEKALAKGKWAHLTQD